MPITQCLLDTSSVITSKLLTVFSCWLTAQTIQSTNVSLLLETHCSIILHKILIKENQTITINALTHLMELVGSSMFLHTVVAAQ